MYIGRHVKHPLFSTIIKCHETLCSGSRLFHADRRTDRRPDRQTDIKKLVVVFGSFAKAPKISSNCTYDSKCVSYLETSYLSDKCLAISLNIKLLNRSNNRKVSYITCTVRRTNMFAIEEYWGYYNQVHHSCINSRDCSQWSNKCSSTHSE